MIKKIIQKFVEKHDSYVLLKNDIEYLQQKIKDLVNEKNKLANKLIEINKLIKKLDARNTIVKAIKKVLKGEE